MQSGNGIDLAAVYQLLSEVARTVSGHDRLLNELVSTVNDHTRKFDQLLDVVNGHSRTLADHTHQMEDLTAALAELRAAVGGYHEAVVSQGIHYSELDGRVRRIERHLKLEPNGG